MNDRNFKKFSLSLSELENFIAADTAAISTTLEAAFHFDAEAALLRISEVNQIANTRISTAAQIAAAKALSDAEIASATLSALTHTQLNSIYKRTNNNGATADELNESLNNAADTASREISDYTRNVIDTLEKNATDAIDQINNNSQNALKEINTLIKTIDLDIDSNKKQAEEKLQNLRNLHRTAKRVQEDADHASRVLYKQFEGFSRRIDARCKNAIAEIEEATNTAISIISESVKKAHERIFEMQHKCLDNIKIMLLRMRH